jgi:zinc protease
MRARPGGLDTLIVALALVFAVVTPALSQPAVEQSQTHGVPVEDVVSPGGVHAWLVSDDTVPMLVLNAYWHGGSALEPDAEVGAAGVLADMLTEGAGDMDADAFKVRLEELNMRLSFSSSWDGFSMGLVTLSAHRDEAVEMARLALTAPRFDTGPLERIKGQLVIGIRQRETNAGYIANLALDEAMTPGHPYARRMTLDHVAALTRALLERRRASVLQRESLVVTAVGDISAADLAVVLDRLFGALPQGAAPAKVAPAEIAAPTPLIVKPLPQPQSLVLFAAPGIDSKDPDWIALAVANYIFGGGGFSSRLMNEVREKRGLVYGISTSPYARDGASVIRGAAQTENGDVREAIDVTRAELQSFFASGATQQEVDDAIRYLTGSFALDLDSNVGIASVLSGYHADDRPIDYVNRRNDLIGAVTLADVNRVAARFYDPARFTLIVVGQPEGLE